MKLLPSANAAHILIFSTTRTSSSCGTDRQIAPNKKPRRPRSTGLSNVEAEAGIEPAWADLQATRKNYYFQTVTRVFLRALVIGSTLKSLV